MNERTNSQTNKWLWVQSSGWSLFMQLQNFFFKSAVDSTNEYTNKQMNDWMNGQTNERLWDVDSASWW